MQTTASQTCIILAGTVWYLYKKTSSLGRKTHKQYKTYNNKKLNKQQHLQQTENYKIQQGQLANDSISVQEELL